MSIKPLLKSLAFTSAGACCIAFGAADMARSVTLNFDDGTDSNTVGSFYASQGVTFSNATWTTNFGLAGSSGSLGLNSNGNFIFLQPNAITGTFSSTQNFVSFVGVDIGANGLRIDAYDAVSGGNLLGFDQFIGSDIGVGTFQTLSVAASGIRRFEIYQLTQNNTDGVIIEDLTFNAGSATSVPEPFTIIGSLIGGTAAFRMRKKMSALAKRQ